MGLALWGARGGGSRWGQRRWEGMRGDLGISESLRFLLTLVCSFSVSYVFCMLWPLGRGLEKHGCEESGVQRGKEESWVDDAICGHYCVCSGSKVWVFLQ